MARRISDNDIIMAYKAQLGNMTKTAEAIGLSRQGLYDRMNKSKELTALLNEVDESNKDFGEGQLRKLMQGFEENDLFITQSQGVIVKEKIKKIYPPNVTAVIFYLKTKAQDRGYIENQHVTVDVITVSVGGKKKS